ncbi:pyridoxal phosphate-dependent aminotransferase [Kitasatospora sp. NPDC058444]|uniref:pyridoxal phosphate-dependent aminotransferase n=1 Tax=Kitasatospora sp. NPDC058444 TaxID=3346504 RepID=UPI0036650763
MAGQPRTATKEPLRASRLMEGITQALSVQHNNVVYDMKAAGQDVITLSLGEAFFDLPLPEFGGLTTPGLHHYSHSRGLPELRRLLGKYYESKFALPVDPDTEVIVTAGSKAAIYMALMAILDPGDEVIVPEPYWLSYPAQIRLCKGEPVMVAHDVPVFDFERFVTERTRAVIINNPNNPSGHVYTRAELEHLHELADRHGLLLIVDEAYNEFVPPGPEFLAAGSLDPEKKHTVTVNSMSKNYGVSGWRIGYLIANERLTEQILKINQHLVTCAPTILAAYLSERFDDLLDVTRPQIQRTVQLRNRVAGWFADAGIDTMPGTSTFYLFVHLGASALDSTGFADRLLRESAISVVPGIGYGDSCDRYIRVSVGSESEERIARAVAAIRDLIESTTPEHLTAGLRPRVESGV